MYLWGERPDQLILTLIWSLGLDPWSPLYFIAVISLVEQTSVWQYIWWVYCCHCSGIADQLVAVYMMGKPVAVYIWWGGFFTAATWQWSSSLLCTATPFACNLYPYPYPFISLSLFQLDLCPPSYGQPTPICMQSLSFSSTRLPHLDAIFILIFFFIFILILSCILPLLQGMKSLNNSHQLDILLI